MSLITQIEHLFLKTEKSKKSAHVSFYPTQIIITTYDYTTAGLGLCSIKLTKLPFDVSLEILGRTLIKHFTLTEYNIEHPKDTVAFKKAWNDYKTAAGFKTDKETYKDAKDISCTMTEKDITLTPMENQYNTSYHPISNSVILLPSIISENELGKQLFIARDISIG